MHCPGTSSCCWCTECALNYSALWSADSGSEDSSGSDPDADSDSELDAGGRSGIRNLTPSWKRCPEWRQ